ncbi:MAG: hypothetical protein U1E15_02575 [Hyphomicrobiales bacterium]
MKRMISVLSSMAVAATVAMPLSVVASTEASAKKFNKQQYRDMKATKYANHKTDKKVLKNALIAGTIGGLVGHALPGGKSSTALGIGVGAGAGMIAGSSKWDNYFWYAYDTCMDNY